METSTILATKADLENVRAALTGFKTSLIRWMFFLWVLNLITYFAFWLYFK